MKKLTMLAFGLTILACDLSGGGGGTGSGTSNNFTFTSGYVWVRQDNRSIFAANSADTQTPQVLAQTTDARSPSVSADGKTVVFIRNNQSEIASVPSSGGPTRTILAASAAQRNLRTPVFSPDGKTVAFAFDESATSSIGVVNADGTNFRRVLAGSALAWSSPNFSIDGKKLLVAAGNAGISVTQFHWLDLASNATTQIANSLGSEAQTVVNRAVLSPDNLRVLFDARVSSGATRIFVMSLAAPNAVTKVNDYAAEPNANDRFPAFKSNTIMLYNSDSGGNDGTYEINLDGTGRQLIVPRATETWFAGATS
jgi:TolB protein